MQLLTSPWAEEFDRFCASIQRHGTLVAPFVGKGPLQRLASKLKSISRPRIELLTNLAVDSLLQGTVDLRAIADFCREVPSTTVRRLPGLHAKAYIADDHLAIITSGNLTQRSLFQNYEYGVLITETSLIQQILRDLSEYGSLGIEVSTIVLDELADITASLQDKQIEALQSARASAKTELEYQFEAARESLRMLRAKQGETTNSIFARTILHVLRKGPLSTSEIHPIVSAIHPDLCDDTIDRVINGVHFGKRWKHMVRNAQQALKARRVIEYREGKWSLAVSGQNHEVLVMPTGLTP